MKKLSLLFAVAFAVVGSAMAQMAIPGEIFAKNPIRYANRPVTIKNIEIVQASNTGGTSIGGPSIGGPVGTVSHGAPGAIGTPNAPSNFPCNPPRGYSKVSLLFKGAPEYNGCFFMLDAMKTTMDRECGHNNTPAKVSFRGESRVGYLITAYKLGL